MNQEHQLIKYNDDAKFYNPVDPSTKDLFRIGDDVVICQAKHSLISLRSLIENEYECPYCSSRLSPDLYIHKTLSGYYKIFVKPLNNLTRLGINIKDENIVIEKPEFHIGRMDENKGIFPDLDLSKYLDASVLNKVSRELIVLKKNNGKWNIKLAPNAHSNVFLGDYKLIHGEEKEIDTQHSINIGNSAEEPYIKLFIKAYSD